MISIRYRDGARPRPGRDPERDASRPGRPAPQGRCGGPRSSGGCRRWGDRDVPGGVATGRAASWDRPSRPGGRRLRRSGGPVRTDACLSAPHSVRAERRRCHVRGGWAYRQSAPRPYPLVGRVLGAHHSVWVVAGAGLPSVAARSRSVAAPVRPAALPDRWAAYRSRRIACRRNVIAGHRSRTGGLRGRGAGARGPPAATTGRVVPAPPAGDGAVRTAVRLPTRRAGPCRARRDGGRCAHCPLGRPDPGLGPDGWTGRPKEDRSAASAGSSGRRLVRGIPPWDTAPTGLDLRAVAHARADRHPPTNLVSIPRCHLSRGSIGSIGWTDSAMITITPLSATRVVRARGC